MPEDKTETTSDEGVTDEKTSDEAKKDDVDSEKYVTRDAFNKLIAERDAEKKKRREIEKQINQKKTESGDLESVRQGYEEQIAEIRKESGEKLTRYERAILDSEVKRQLSEVVTHPEAAFKLLKEHFELNEDGDSLSPRVKNSGFSIAEFAVKQLTKEGLTNLLKSTRKAGTETNKGEGGGEKKEPTIEDFGKMTSAEQKIAAAKYPKLASEVIRSGSANR